jgi:hypothetical protein
MIGSMFDETWLYGDLTDPPMHNLQTVPVPPGSTAMMDFMAVYPGNYPLVDHQIANAIDKGAYAILNVSGPANHTIFQTGVATEVWAPASAAYGEPGSAMAAVRAIPAYELDN